MKNIKFLFVALPLALIGCTLLPMGVPIKGYEISSLSSFGSKEFDKKIKIYLVSQHKRNYERNSGRSIAVSNNCVSEYGYGEYNSPIVIEKAWKAVENKAFSVSSKNNIPISFVCSAKEADYIFEYSYMQEMPYSGVTTLITLPFHIALLGIPPFINHHQYNLFLNIINVKTNSLIRSEDEEFRHTIVSSSLLLPFMPLIEPEENSIDNIKLDTIAKMIVDKSLEYSRDLM